MRFTSLALIAILILSGCNSTIKVTGTNINDLRAEYPAPDATELLGKADSTFRSLGITVEYYDINLGASAYNVKTFEPVRGDNFLVVPIWIAQGIAAGVEYAGERNELEKSQRGGLVIFRNSYNEIDYVIKTKVITDKESGLQMLGDLFLAATKGDAYALALLGTGGVNRARRFAFNCHASHRGNQLAMERVANDYVNYGRNNTYNPVVDRLVWFALAYPEIAQQRLRIDNQLGIEESFASGRSIQKKHSMDLVRDPYLTIRKLFLPYPVHFPKGQKLADLMDELIKKLSQEEHDQLIEKINNWAPDPSSCPPLRL